MNDAVITQINKDKCAQLAPWMKQIISSVKKDLRKEHLEKDRLFCQKYFAGKLPAKLSAAEIAEGYLAALENDGRAEELAEYILSRWLMKNTDVYNFFAKELSSISADFSELKSFSATDEARLKTRALEQFDAEVIYLFSVINEIVFSPLTFDELRMLAIAEQAGRQQPTPTNADVDYPQQIARLTDKYEKKIAGWERKYDNDIKALKKQIAQLQRQLQNVAIGPLREPK